MIYTLGYTGTSLAQLQAFLDAHQAMLVDIRYKPTSRNPMWRQQALQAALGRRYVHVGALGNRNYTGGPIAIVDLAGGIQTVRTLLEQAPAIALMCVCSDVDRCHRKGVADAIGQVLGCPVEHIALKTTASRQLTLEW